jgi:S-adenosylmethionine:tRNA ribosyltransferase-isomerase
MIAARDPQQHRPDARLLVIAADGSLTHAARADLVDFLRRGDLVIANDAATLPASLHGVHLPTGAPIEVRLAGWLARRAGDLRRCIALVFGAGDSRTRTEDRPLPPALTAGDRLALGPLAAVVERTLDHARLIALRFDGSATEVWAGLARHGRPIQYAHIPAPLSLWDVWTPIAGAPVAFEPPSAGFALDWRLLAVLRDHGIGFATLTHAAGISSTGDADLDRRLPLHEPYFIPANTSRAIRRTQARRGRIVAVGTTVVRALEHAASLGGGVRPGAGIAKQRIGARTKLRVVDAVLSGTHEPGSSHHDLLRAFTDDATLRAANAALDARRYRTHEFGDSMLVERRGLYVPCMCESAERATARCRVQLAGVM